ncbi:hypothetical protein AC249_AIPGENE11206 [Exaiptasia diaphana]|nr:hypothetical protein AC249_AIPGENE11206 [Exaiptasia diaphana]
MPSFEEKSLMLRKLQISQTTVSQTTVSQTTVSQTTDFVSFRFAKYHKPISTLDHNTPALDSTKMLTETVFNSEIA